MLMPMTEFFNTLPTRNCCECNDQLEEMADCYSTTCESCNGTVYYPLSPLTSVNPN
jgi:predicted nucleic acid-binding Zn ribbon protein